MKTLEKIPFSELDSIPLLIKDFLSGKLSDSHDKAFSLPNIRKQAETKSAAFSDGQRQILIKSLKDQFADLPLSPKQAENLDYLAQNTTFTVTTGHQLNLFSGPVFFIYKILQTIKTARFLTTEISNCHFVPIFWMASEDHDFEEINHFKTEGSYYEVQAQSGGAVGAIKIEAKSFIVDFENEFKDDVFGTELILMLKEAYAPGKNLADATRRLVQRLFSEYGLLILDGNDVALKQQMIPVFKEELLHQSVKEYTKDKISFLEEKYGKVQVNPREINLFYLSETRDRIILEDGIFKVVDRELQFLPSELIQELEAHPEKFSPNALLRPVFQEVVLPNVAYIGGNAEIMYWLELPDYFDNIKLPFPVLIPRNSFLMITEKNAGKLKELHISLRDLFKNFAGVIEGKLTDNHEISTALEHLEKTLQLQFKILKDAAQQTDLTFRNLAEAEETRQLKSFKKMRKRLLRAEKIKQSEFLERLETLYQSIHPSGVWQERIFNFSVFYAGEGKSWIEFCLEEMPVEKPEMVIAVI